MEDLRCYLVGGAVRDALLGRPVVDRDWVVVGATVDDMLARGFIRVGRDFPVFIHPQSGEEYALARTERKAGHGHTGFAVFAAPSVTLEEDLARRDLTINAIARKADGTLVDPFHGKDDLAAQCLRHVSEAFAEDPLRVLRVARFAAQLPGFQVHASTLQLMAAMCARGDLTELSAERVWGELRKALDAPAPARFVAVLGACGGVSPWFSELAGMSSFAGEGALARYARLPVAPRDHAALHARLKVPNAFKRAAADWHRFGPLLQTWHAQPDAVAVDALTELFEGLKVAHDLERLRELLEIAGADAPELLALAHGYADVRLTRAEQAQVHGPAMGAALVAKRRAYLQQADG